MTRCSHLDWLRLIGLVVVLLMVAPADAAPGDLDTSFGAGGVVTSDLLPIAALQPDGKLIVAGIVSQTNPAKLSWLIRRYAIDGSPDLSFGTNFNGAMVVSFDVSFRSFSVPSETVIGNDLPSGILPMIDGRFVVGGTSKVCVAAPPYPVCATAFIAARFNADGTLDTSFGSSGKVVDLGPSADSMAMQGDGKILGFSSSNGFILAGPPSPVLVRLNADGSPDGSFAPTIACVGKGAFRLTPNGKIVVITGSSQYPSTYGICVTQLNADGTTDTAFGNQGTSFVGAGAFGTVTAFFIDAAGGIVAAGGLVLTGSNPTPVAFRLTQDGGLDTHFGSGGIVAIDGLSFTAVAGDCHNRTLVAGQPPNGQGYFLIRRVLQDGSIDASFTASPPGNPPTDLLSYAVEQLLVRPNGRIVALALENFPGPSFGTGLSIIQYQGDLPCSTTVAVEYYYAAWNYYFETSFPDEVAALDGGAFGGAWKRTGETFNVWPQPNASASPTCRFFSTSFAPKSSHFYTPFPVECAIVKTSASWQFESIAFYVQIPIGYGTGNGFCPPGTTALYRAYNNGMGGAPNHRYTPSLATLNTMLAQGWVFEGEANTKVFACVPQ